MSKQQSALVIGAGVGGCAIAARLACAGYRVTVVEKNDFTGGRCSLIHSEKGYRFDRGPSLLLLPKLFQEAFEDLGSSIEQEGIELKRCNPNYVVHYADGESLVLSSDLTQMKQEIERFEGIDGFDGFLGFMREAHTHYEASVDHVLHRNFDTFFSLLRPAFLRYIIALHPFSAIYKRASLYFKTDRLRRAFTFSTMYMGMSPMEAPATYSLLQYTEITEGIWYPIGGFHQIVQGIVNIAKRKGVTFRLNAPVKRVIVSEGTARGVELDNGESIMADTVVINADLVYAYQNLLPTSTYGDSVAKRESSCSSISFYWSLDRKIPELQAHNIFLADEYAESFDAIFKRHAMPDDPSFYVNVPSRIDPSAAPEGKDAIVVLVPIGHITETGSQQAVHAHYEELVKSARRMVLSRLGKQLGLTRLADHIIEERYYQPVTWKEDLNLDKGAILGISHSFFNVLSFRPKTKHASIKNCYFVGASAHPGTGVPIVLAGSKLTAEQILSDQGKPIPWQPWSRKAASLNISPSQLELDKARRPALDLVWIAAILLAFLVLALTLSPDFPLRYLSRSTSHNII